MSRGTQVPATPGSLSGTRLSLAMAGLSSPLPLATSGSFLPALQPRLDESSRFRLFPVRSPLLWESRLISFPAGTEMFHFPALAHTHLFIQCAVTGHDSRRVPPFRNLRIEGCLAPPRSLSQPTTSFVASQRQGIHLLPLLSCLLRTFSLPLPYAIFNVHSGQTGVPSTARVATRMHFRLLPNSNQPSLSGCVGGGERA